MNFGGNKKSAGWDKLKKSIYPTNKQERERRMRQYRDIGLFALSIVLMGVFEKKVQRFLQVDKSDITSFSNMQQSLHSAY